MKLDLTIPHKRIEATIRISSNRQATINNGEEFFTMDGGGTAVGIFNFEIEGENGEYKELDLTSVKEILIGFDFTVVDSKMVLEPEILDAKNGRVALVLPNQFEYSGPVLGHTYIIWEDRELDGGAFQLNFTESWLDKNLPDMEDFYVKRFEDLAEEIRRRVEEIKAEMDKELKAVKQDITTAKADLDRIQSQIDDKDVIRREEFNNLASTGRNILRDGRIPTLQNNNNTTHVSSQEVITENGITFIRCTLSGGTLATNISMYNAFPRTQITEDLAGKTVELTHKIRANKEHTGREMIVTLYGGVGTVRLPGDGTRPIANLSTNWQTIRHMVTIPETYNQHTGLRFILVGAQGVEIGDWVDFRDWSISIVDDKWSLPVEDMEARLDNIETLKPNVKRTVATFDGKLVGSTIENPHFAGRAIQSLVIHPPTHPFGEFTKTHYDAVGQLNDSRVTTSNTIANAIPQQRYEFNIIAHLERNYSATIWQGHTALADKVRIAKQIVKRITCHWHGFGMTNNTYWVGLTSANSLTTWGTGVVISTSGVVKRVSRIDGTQSLIDTRILSDGTVRYLAHTALGQTTPIGGATLTTAFVQFEVDVETTLASTDWSYSKAEIDALKPTRAPLPLATTPQIGTSGRLADESHVHQLPTASQVGAVPSSGGTYTGGVTFNSDAILGSGVGIVTENTINMVVRRLPNNNSTANAAVRIGRVTFNGNWQGVYTQLRFIGGENSFDARYAIYYRTNGSLGRSGWDTRCLESSRGTGITSLVLHEVSVTATERIVDIWFRYPTTHLASTRVVWETINGSYNQLDTTVLALSTLPTSGTSLVSSWVGSSPNTHGHSANDVSSGTLSIDRLPNVRDNNVSIGPTANTSLTFGGAFPATQFTADTKGRVTSMSTRTMTMPTLPTATQINAMQSLGRTNGDSHASHFRLNGVVGVGSTENNPGFPSPWGAVLTINAADRGGQIFVANGGTTTTGGLWFRSGNLRDGQSGAWINMRNADWINSGTFSPNRIATTRHNWIFHTNDASNTVASGSMIGNGLVVGTGSTGDSVAITLARNNTGNVWSRFLNNGGNLHIQRKTGDATTWTNMLSFDSSSNATFNGNAAFHGNITALRFIGNADTATRLQTPRLINGVAFDGSTNINIQAQATHIQITNWNSLSGLVTSAQDRDEVRVSSTNATNGPDGHRNLQGRFSRYDSNNGLLEVVPHTNGQPIVKYYRRFGNGQWGEWFTDSHEKPVWTNLTPINGTAIHSTGSLPQYCKIGHVVHLRGAFTNILGPGTICATLPVGFRPVDQTHNFVQNTTIGNNITYFARWSVNQNGTIELSRINRTDGYVPGNWFPIHTSFVVG